jgi:uncharacterized cupredoxin-like copper-binding protein
MPLHPLVAALAGAALLAGHGPTHPARAPRVVTVVATDYHFTLPASLPAGPTTFRLVNHGRELHHLDLVRLQPGHTAADFVRALKAGGPPPAWASEAGGPNGVDPGGTSTAVTVPLEAGRYAAICIIPGPDGVPHLMKGMYADLVVTPAAVAVAREAAPHDTMDLFDYGFRASRPLASGEQRMVVRNVGKQTHEMEIARLLPGKTPADLGAWAEKMAGPPPAQFLGGVSPIAAGRSNVLDVSLTPGHYVLLCFVPDAADGKPHVAHGMVHDVVVK